MKIVAIIQARMGSSRLPGKVMKVINGKPLIELLICRLSKSKEIDQIVVATSSNKNNLPLIKYIRSLGYSCEVGSEDDVLDRFVNAANKHNADTVVRITGDCPLIDPILVDSCIRLFRDKGVDYLCNRTPPSYPDGLDVEVIKFDSLKKAAKETTSLYDREHVTPYIYQSGKFLISTMQHSVNLSKLRWTVDDGKDFEVVEGIFNYFYPNIHFGWEKILELEFLKPNIFMANKKTIRNEGALMGKGQKLWRRAKEIIPGGNMLLSKRAEMFLPDYWPSYYSKAKGCRVWDLDGKEYIDMSIMGIGTNTLGYGNQEVDLAVKNAVDAGNMSTLNCPEEVYLAERLIEIHPWASMTRFARSGGEANAIAIRIARAASGKDKVAICGYHGWHDWYLSANLNDDKSLDGHLLPGLEPKGVPRNLKGTVFPFKYNSINELQILLKNHDIGVIKMEVQRNNPPENDFLKNVRKLATENNVVLIFDECTSGFRETFGGLHKKYGIEPDMAMFGKAIGNGYAITAIIGRKEIMESAQSSFISSTFWTERIGSVAALKTLEVMERVKSWEIITSTGLEIQKGWQNLADRYNLDITHWGIPALAGFSFQSPRSLAYKTLISQEMLKKGYLASNSVYSSIEHTPDIVNNYFENLEPIFSLIQECENGKDINSLLQGEVSHSGFKRLN